LIEAANIRKIYNRGAAAVEAVGSASFAVAEGEFVSLLGPSGCGKSTLLMMAAGLESITEGQLTINATKVAGPRRDVSVVFQDAVLLPWKSILENTLFPIHIQKGDTAAHREKALTLLRSVGLGEFCEKRPDQLSGGMKQRVALCRALINDPTVLLMDEPFSALDAVTRDQMNVVLMDLWQKIRKTALFVTHSIREAVFLSDRVIVMSARPSRIVWEQVVPFARPRAFDIEDSPAFNAICSVLRSKIDMAHAGL
jgi:NitT/TauT family transport system ATP-binding protein